MPDCFTVSELDECRDELRVSFGRAYCGFVYDGKVAFFSVWFNWRLTVMLRSVVVESVQRSAGF